MLTAFYEECLKYFAECSVANQGSVQNPTNVNLRRIILWNSEAICVDGKSVYIKRLANIGIPRIGDLISEDNKLITNKLHVRELKISPLDAFRLTCVIEALPIEWCIFLKTCNHSVIEPFNLVKMSYLAKPYRLIIYKEIRNRNVTSPTAQLKYNAQFTWDVLHWKKYTAYHIV